MSVRNYAILWPDRKSSGGTGTISGGNQLLSVGQHALDGAEHTGQLPEARLSTTETDTSLRLAPDGIGGVEWATTAAGFDTPVDHGSMGASETVDLAAGPWHRGTLDADCTITVQGFTADQGVTMIVKLEQDGTGGWAITWDADVIFSGDDQPDPTAGSVTWFMLWSDEGDSVIYAAKIGGGGTGLTISDEGSPLTTAASSLDFVGAGVVASGATSAKTVTISGEPAGAAGGDLSGTYPNPSVVDDSHSHTSATAPGGIGPLLLASDKASPIVFDDILQASDGNDFLYASEP